MKKFLFSALSLSVAMSLNATVFATVDGMDITEKEMAPLLGGMGNVDINALNAEQKKQLLDKTIELQLLINEAKKAGVTNTDVYKNELEKAKDTIALRVWEASEASKIKIADKDITDFYNKNKARFVEPARMKASHILVKTEADANAIIKQLKGLNGGALVTKFSELAKAKSLDPSAKQNGGQLGWFSGDQMVKPFATATQALKNGQITTKPVKSQYGYHVILKEGEQAKKQYSKDEAKPFIEGTLRQQEATKMVAKKATELRSKAKIEYK